jgi:hypothetical protein
MKRAAVLMAASAAASGFAAHARAESVFVSSMELPTEIDTTHPGGSVQQSWTWGDSFDSNVVDHAQSSLFATDGSFSMHVHDPNGGFSFGTQYLINRFNEGANPNEQQGIAKFEKVITTTKLLLDFTTVPSADPAATYASGFGAINYAGGFLDSYNPSGLGKNYGVVGSPASQTAPVTQTYTWDFGPQMTLGAGSPWAGVSHYIIFHFASNSPAGVPTDYYYDNFRFIDENTAIHPTWAAAGTGDWLAPASWANGVPNAVGARAIFYGAGDGNVTLNSAATLGALVLDAAVTSYENIDDAVPPPIVNYTVGGTGSLTFDATGSAGEIFVIAGNHNINVPVTFNDAVRIDTSAGFGKDSGAPINPPNGRTSQVPPTSLGFGGPVTLAAGVTLSTSGAGSVSFNGEVTGGAGSTVHVRGGSTTFGGNVNVGALNLSGSARATVTAGGNKTVVVNALTVAPGGKLDMTDNDMIVDYTGTSPEFALRDKVLLARDGDAEGIFFTGSDDDFSDKILALGEAAELGFTEFNGATVDDTTVLGKYTYYGDANFDGQVTTDDYVAVDLGLGTGDSWVQGDFDLNGVVTTDDYVVVDLNLGKGSDNPLAYADEQAAMIALHTEMFGQSYLDKLAYASDFGWVAASVPEPGALSLLASAGAAVLRRRRRN